MLVASYIFYGAWNWKFLLLILLSTIVDYFCGLGIYRASSVKKKKAFLVASIVVNLSILGFFKYFNFFAGNLQILLQQFGFSINPFYINIVLPVGISFYTFQTMSYTIDIYRENLKPTDDFLDFALFVAFFPQLVAGPIERAKHLLPQILSPRRLKADWFYEGLFLVFLGLFQKMFIADNLARIVDPIFALAAPYKGIDIILGTYMFAFQIYCDFAGYSNIARGLGRLMGFDIMINFNSPYLSTNPSEFWRRWHISLSSWLRDYLYIPLGGNRKGSLITYRNLALTMILGGLWHGAAWTFVLWGIYQGALLVGYRLLKPLISKIREPRATFLKHIWFALRVFFFFQLTCLGWLIFRARSVAQIVAMLKGVVLNIGLYGGSSVIYMIGSLVFFIVLLSVIEFFQYHKNDVYAVLHFKPVFQMALYLIMLFSMLFLGVTGGEEFIYFQF